MPLEKRSFSLSGHRTSVALEPEFWTVLERMAGPGTLSALVAGLDDARADTGEKLASTLRVAALTFLQADATQAGYGPKSSPPIPETGTCGTAASPPTLPAPLAR